MIHCFTWNISAAGENDLKKEQRKSGCRPSNIHGTKVYTAWPRTESHPRSQERAGLSTPKDPRFDPPRPRDLALTRWERVAKGIAFRAARGRENHRRLRDATLTFRD